MKRPQASRLARMGCKLGLALACAMVAGQAAAVPYASQIRFAETQLVQSLGTDLLYTLNEDADSVSVQVYNATTNTVVRTFNFTAPAPQTRMGRQSVSWNGRDESNNLLPLGGDELVIRVNVKKVDNSTAWTPLSSNGSGIKATLKTSIFNGWSANDVIIPTDPTSDQFGLVLTSHSYTPAAPGGIVLLGTDLEPVIGNGGGVNAVKGQHIATAAPGSFGVWNMNFDPINPNLVWWAGQTGTHRIGVFDVSGVDPNDIQAVADVVYDVTSPRSIAIGVNGNGDRVGYLAVSNQIERLTLSTTYPHVVQETAIITAPQLDGTARYAQEIELDSDGNLYYLSRSAQGPTNETQGTLWRWNKAVVDAATPESPLTDANAAWHVRVPVGTTSVNTMHIDRISGDVYIAANALASNPRGIFRVGNIADASLPAKPYQLTLDNQILDYSNPAQFPVNFSGSLSGHGIATDWKGNMYTTTRTQEEIYSFSPPGNGAEYDIDTASPAGYFANIAFSQSNLVFVDQNAVSDGVSVFNSVRDALLSFGPGGHNNGFPGTNRIEVQSFGPFDGELPDLTVAFDADDFEIVATNGPALVLQRGSTWELGKNVSIDGLVIAASSTSTPTGTLVSSTAGTQTIDNSWITALPAAAASYTSVANIPAGIADGTSVHDASLVRAGDGLTISGGAVSATNTIISQHTNGVISTGSELSLSGSRVVANSANGITASTGSVSLASASHVSNNGGTGIAISGNAGFTSNSSFANPNQLVGNASIGLAHSSSTAFALRNTLINGSNVGLDIQSGSVAVFTGDYPISDVIISESTTAGIRIANANGFSAARLTLYGNGIGVQDTATRTGFWSMEFQDTIIAGPGGVGISSPGASLDVVRMDHVAMVTAGPDALATVADAPAGALSTIDAPILNADPAFHRTAYSPFRLAPDFYLAPSSPAYRNAAAPFGTQQGDGSLYEFLGGGSRWRIESFVVVDTIFQTNFETDQSSNFTVSEFFDDTSIDFQYDYSTFTQEGGGFPVSIPPSPWNTGSGTRGVRMATNLSAAVANGITATLNAIPPQSNMKITIDAWQNWGSTGSTETISFGASANPALPAMTGTNYFTSPNEPFDGFFFSVAAEGGQAQDYRYYDGNGVDGAIGNNALRANFLGNGSVDNNSFGGIFPSPPAQVLGAPGKSWVRWEIDVFQDHIRLHVTRQDGQRFLLCDWFYANEAATTTNLLPHFGSQDLFAASIASPAANQFVLVDYIRVQTIEPGEEEPPVGMLGDINDDGIINVADVTALGLLLDANNAPPLAVGDINNDGFVNEADLQALADMIVNP